MAIRDIALYPDPVLRRQAEEIKVFDDELRQLVDDMFETMYAAPGVGLAAPQIGVSRQVIVLDPGEREGEKRMPTALINPRIVEYSGGLEWEEGCLSIPDFTGVVPRAEFVVVEAKTIKGKPIRMEAGGFVSVILQHEIDHIEGVLFVDRLGKVRRRLFIEEFGAERMRAPRHKIIADTSALVLET